jgi:hypothetical protein
MPFEPPVMMMFLFLRLRFMAMEALTKRFHCR